MEIKNVFVAGAGFMGSGIAEMAALAGYSVTMQDLDDGRLQVGLDEIRSSLEKFLAKAKITPEQRDAVLGNLSLTTRLEDASTADLVVEAVPENLELKRELFYRLDGICPPHTVLASNTSAIPITAIAASTARPDRVVGTHFFGPVPLMRLCEIVGGVLTSRQTVEATDAWARSTGRETVRVLRDVAGFVANRVTIPSSLEAVRMVEEGEASPAEVDRVSSMGNPAGTGTLTIMDRAGLDVSLAAAQAIYDDTADPRFFPPPLLRRMVAAGLKGRKSGKGFYDYTAGGKSEYELVVAAEGAGAPARTFDSSRALNRLFLPMVIEAAHLVETGVAAAEDVDRAVRLGFNFPLGPLQIADSMGLDGVLDAVKALRSELGEARFAPPLELRRLVEEGRLGRKAGAGFYAYGEGEGA